MKKNSVLPLAATCLLLFAACEKKPMTPLADSVQQEPAAESAAKVKPDPDPSIDGTWDEHFHDCFLQVRTNCTILEEIIVTPNFTSRVLNANTTAAVATLFNDPEFAYIANSLPPEHREHLQAGDYYIAIASETNQTVCLFMGTSAQLNSSNMSLVLKYNK